MGASYRTAAKLARLDLAEIRAQSSTSTIRLSHSSEIATSSSAG